MNQAEVLGRLQSIFDQLFIDQVVLTPELSATDVLEWDSLMQINLIIAVESSFRIRFRMGEVEATENVGQFADLIIRRMSEAK